MLIAYGLRPAVYRTMFTVRFGECGRMASSFFLAEFCILELCEVSRLETVLGALLVGACNARFGLRVVMAKNQDHDDVAAAHRSEVQRGERFEFGQNWQEFLKTLDDERIAVAENSLKEMLGKDKSRTMKIASFYQIVDKAVQYLR